MTDDIPMEAYEGKEAARLSIRTLLSDYRDIGSNIKTRAMNELNGPVAESVMSVLEPRTPMWMVRGMLPPHVPKVRPWHHNRL